MMERQKHFVDYLENLATLLEKSDINSDPALLARVSETELLVPFIGAFSAGKSSLLNTLLDQDILPVGIAPETELATELRYSPESYLLAIHNDGSEERLPVEALSEINRQAGRISHLQLYINCSTLKRIAPLVLVDMPGYGSSLESHNKAINFYLPRGVHFVVVTSIEDGNLTQSMIRRLDDVKTYGGDFTFVLNKCNLRSNEQVMEVRDYINDQLKTYFEGDHETLVIGKGSVNTIAKALEQIDVNALFDRLFLDALKGQSHDLVRQFNLAISVLKKDDGQAERELQGLERALVNLKNQQEDMEDQIQHRYSARLLDRCLRGIEGDLGRASEELAALASTSGNQRLNATLSEIIRDSLTRHLQQEVKEISMQMIEDLATGVSVSSSNLTNVALGEGWVTDITLRVKDSLERTNQMLNDWSSRMSTREAERDEKDDKSEKVGRLYKAASITLAVTTSVVVPALELAIIFLPEILRMFNRSNERQMIINKLQGEIFPDVKAELRKRLPEILDEQLAIMLNKVKQTFEEQINQQQSVIASYRQTTDATKAETEDRLSAIEELANAVKALATRYLYAGE